MSPQPQRNPSTGPRTDSGKDRSSRNALRHGLASNTLIMPGEEPAQYTALEQSLLNEHQPQTPSETILVTQMATHHWLSRRAVRLQAEVLDPKTRKRGEIPRSLEVLHRYQVSNDRAFHKCLALLNDLRKQQHTAAKQFVSQRVVKHSPQPAPIPLDLDELHAISPLMARIAAECSPKMLRSGATR